MLLVVGGQGRRAGKTSLAAGIIRKFRSMQWTAIKISPHLHGGTFGMREDSQPGPSDTGRFLAAGAKRAVLMTGANGPALAAAVQRIAAASNTIVESNTLVELTQPNAYLFVVNPGCPGLKPSGRRNMSRADAFVVVAGWNRILPEVRGRMLRRPQFIVRPPDYASAAVCVFVRRMASDGSN
jgi:hypothetical protein